MSKASDLETARKLTKWAWIVSLVVFLLVVSMRRFKIQTDIDFSALPAIYSGLNVMTAILLVLAYYFIRVKKNIIRHRAVMQSAIICSALFLLLYVLYHITTQETLYCGEGTIRILYFVILISHIILAATILPFILLTYIRAYTNQFAKHKRMARWVWPLWLYVAITGPLVYMFLLPCHA